MSVVPVFLLSLPRSGSTLVQRILAAHPEVSSVSEPWVLLPLLYTFRRRGIRADYNHDLLVRATEDFCNVLPRGIEDYRQAVRHFAAELYTKAAPTARYFVDKTPRYHLVISELLGTFPQGYFIVVWRNPLDVAASIVETWGNGRWNLHRFEVDLREGLENLLGVTRAHPQRVLRIRYEELVTEPEPVVRRMLEYLGLEWDERTLSGFPAVPLEGRFGDTLRIRNRSIRSDSVDRWKATFANPLRRRWCRRYLDWIGQERLEWMGYDPDHLKQELQSLPRARRFLFSDVLRRTYAAGRAIGNRARELGEELWRRSSKARRRI